MYVHVQDPIEPHAYDRRSYRVDELPGLAGGVSTPSAN